MIILSIVNISIVTFRFSEVQKFKNLTSRTPIFGNQEVKNIDFKSSGFRNTAYSSSMVTSVIMKDYIQILRLEGGKPFDEKWDIYKTLDKNGKIKYTEKQNNNVMWGGGLLGRG